MSEGQEVTVPQPTVSPIEAVPSAPIEAPKPPERIIPRIQQFTEQLQPGLSVDKLTQESKQLYEKLADENIDLKDEEREELFKKYSESLKDPANNLSDEAKLNLANVKSALEEGKITRENLLESIRGVVNSPELDLDDIQKKLSNDSLEEIEKVANNPGGSDEQKESKVKELFNKIPKPVKLILLAIFAMFGLTLFKAFKSSGSGGQMGRAA